MHGLKRLVEWYLGVPPTQPGQGTSWQLDYRTPWPAAMPQWTVLLAVLAALALVVLIYRRDAGRTRAPLRILMTGLRLAAVVLVLVFLSRLSLRVEQSGLPVVVLLVDDSASMGLEDHYRDESSQRTVKRLLASIDAGAVTRLNVARALMTGDEASFLKQIVKQQKLRVYRFSETASPMGEGDCVDSASVDALVPQIAALEPRGNHTRPGPAVRKVLEEMRGTPPSAVVILSDGIASTGEADRLSGVIELAREEHVPIFAVGIGSAEPALDVQLYDVVADDVAFVNDLLAFSAKVRSFGCKGKDVTVTLKEQNSQTVLASNSFRMAEDGRPIPIEVAYTPPQTGEFDYVLEVTPLADEHNRNNNSETRHVSVRSEKIRVLLADSSPRYEFRALKQLLEREKTVELKTILQEADIAFAEEDRTALNHFPVRREDLAAFDVVILGDVNPAALTTSVSDNLRDFVLNSGGGLILIAGPAFNPAAYQGTPLTGMLPIELAGSSAPPPDVPITEGFRPELTADGRKMVSLFRFGADEAESDAIWKELPPLYWMFEASTVKSGARVFVRHPQRRGEKKILPVIVLQQYGAGKVLFHGTDELWRWRYLVGDTYYGHYWIHAIRFLSRSKLIGRDHAAELSTDRLAYELGESIELRLRFLDGRAVPGDGQGVAVMVESAGGAHHRVPLAATSGPQPTFEGTLNGAGEGAWHAWVASPTFKEAPPSADFRVEAPRRELENRVLDRPDMEATAERTHGRYFSIDEARSLPEELPRGRSVPLETRDPIPLWNRWELLLLFAGVLLAEWLLRKRARLI